MSRALIIDFELCGLGHDAGPPRTIRLGLVHIAIVPGGFIRGVRRQSRAFVACRRILWVILERARAAAASSGAKKAPQMALDSDFLAELEEAVTVLRETDGTSA